MSFAENQYEIDLVIGMARDTMSNFLYYDRKDCAQLPVHAIEDYIINNVLTVDDIVLTFREVITKSVEDRMYEKQN